MLLFKPFPVFQQSFKNAHTKTHQTQWISEWELLADFFSTFHTDKDYTTSFSIKEKGVKCILSKAKILLRYWMTVCKPFLVRNTMTFSANPVSAVEHISSYQTGSDYVNTLKQKYSDWSKWNIHVNMYMKAPEDGKWDLRIACIHNPKHANIKSVNTEQCAVHIKNRKPMFSNKSIFWLLNTYKSSCF